MCIQRRHVVAGSCARRAKRNHSTHGPATPGLELKRLHFNYLFIIREVVSFLDHRRSEAEQM